MSRNPVFLFVCAILAVGPAVSLSRATTDDSTHTVDRKAAEAAAQPHQVMSGPFAGRSAVDATVNLKGRLIGVTDDVSAGVVVDRSVNGGPALVAPENDLQSAYIYLTEDQLGNLVVHGGAKRASSLCESAVSFELNQSPVAGRRMTGDLRILLTFDHDGALNRVEASRWDDAGTHLGFVPLASRSGQGCVDDGTVCAFNRVEAPSDRLNFANGDAVSRALQQLVPATAEFGIRVGGPEVFSAVQVDTPGDHLSLPVGSSQVTNAMLALNCVNDVQGADDEPGQKDLNRLCLGIASDYPGTCTGDFTINWNWDEVDVAGNNTLDACALFDTDGDGNVDFALCVEADGFIGDFLYSCSDQKIDRCTNPVLITTKASHCTASTMATDPWPCPRGGETCPNDQVATCCIELGDFGTSGAVFIDTCSYPSDNPNSDPSDCIFLGASCSSVCPGGNCSGGPCDDHVGCTADSCQVVGTDTTCVHTPDDTQCDDGNPCTDDTCSPASGTFACVFTPAPGRACGDPSTSACDNSDTCDANGSCGSNRKPATTSCRPATGPCDVAESCDGESPNCPPDVFRPSTTTCTGTSSGGACDATDSCDGAGHCVDGYLTATTPCRPSTGPCDLAESCSGTSGACPANVLSPSTTPCTGTSNGGLCDGTDSCDGAGHCVDGYLTATTICRAATGDCDAAESCTGNSGACPADGFQPSTTTCTGSSHGGACDGTDSCDGAGHCVEGYLTATTICRPATGDCDVAESCMGNDGDCPADVFKPSTTTCTGSSHGGACDGTDSCDGAGHCVEGYLTATTICRQATGECDAAESCTGKSGACPSDVFQPSTTTCTGASHGGLCDAADSCDGAGHCVEGYLTATTICRQATGVCDAAESCTGTSGECPADVFKPSTTTCTGTSNGGACDGTDSCDGAGRCVDGYRTATTVCRPATGDCDVAESCTGKLGTCPADVFQPSTTTCAGTSSGGACDGTDSCDGAGHCIDGYLTATTTCRPSTGPCDLAESCPGASGACPANTFAPSTTSCTGTSSDGACDGTDSCDGSGHCVDGYLTATTTCRPSTGPCDPAESCPGTSGACPANTFSPSTTKCTGTSSDGACDGTDSCDGAGHCVDGYLTSTTTCRSSTGPCDLAESCPGTSGACPANTFAPSTTSCTGTSSDGACDGTDSCDGAGHCIDGYLTATTTCRPSTGPCDLAESCPGTSGACPANTFAPSTTSCTGTSNGGACDGTDSCDSAGHCVDGYRPATTVCRGAASSCDVAESCTGTSGACPTNRYSPSTTPCTGTSSGGACDGTDSCDGAGLCRDGYKSATTICRPTAGPCDQAESCTGTSGACPANAFKPSTTSCTGTSNNGACDGTDSCDGTGHCLDGYKPATTICRPPSGQCDAAESCTGTSGACPANGFSPPPSPCTGTSNGGACDAAADACDGAGHCVDVYLPLTTVCRPSTGNCDVAESCTGNSGTCPTDVRNTGVCQPIVECTPPYPFASSNPQTSIAFAESEVLRSFTATVGDGCLPNQIRVYYNDEHALVLGVRRVVVKSGTGSTPTDYQVTPMPSSPGRVFDPFVGSTAIFGEQAGVDVSGRPMFPALFITDTTANPGSLGGDWQNGGTPIPPHAVFGTWKAAVRTIDTTRSPVVVTVTPDQDPAPNHWDLHGGDPAPPGLVDQGFGAEARWDTTRLGLIPGHTYRFYFMVHDGDQNKAGGDSGQGCVNVQTAPVCPGPCRSNADCDDRDICTTDTCTNGVCTNEIPPGSQCLCAASDCPNVDPSGSITSTVDASGDVTVTFRESAGINDNSYGTNAVTWPNNSHTFGNLTGSDKANFVFKDGGGNVVMNFFLDYISAKTGTPSGYASLGATDGDGSITVGSASWLMSWQTSLAANLNNTGYCSGGNCTVSGVNLLVNSPPTSPRTSYNVAPAFSQWIFPITYTVKISHSAFGAAGFGSVSVPSLHNSPPKCGDNVTSFGTCPCNGTIGNFVWNDLTPNGIQDAGEPGIGGVAVTLVGSGQNLATTTDDNGFYEFTGVCPGSYTVTVNPSTVPPWLIPTLCHAGGDDTKDNNCSPGAVTLTQNHPSDASIDFGYRGRACVNASNCADGNVCNGVEACVGNVCKSGTPLSCDDGVTCTVDSCNPSSGCVHASTVGAAAISSGFNGTTIPVGRTVWFNANFKAKGIKTGVTTVRWLSSTITLKSGAQTLTLAVPDGQIVFDSAATCATTSFNVGLQRWETRVPVSGSDEIFLSGLAFPVPTNLPGGIKPVAWTGNFTVDKPGVGVTWKWGAAVYDTSMTDYNSLGVKPTHDNACSYSSSDHAGTPENKKDFVVGGARGGGGSNSTGSWSGTQTLKLSCVAPQTADSGPVSGLSFLDKQQLSWSVASDATSYDVIQGDVMDLRAGSGIGPAFCADDDLDTTQSVESLEPQPGQCFFYVVRGDAVSPAAGTYDTLRLPPIGDEGRDQEIGTTGGDCPHRQQ